MPKLLVNIDVDDLEKAVDFYTRAFELRLGRRFGTGAVELLGTDAPLYLLACEPGTPAFRGATATRDFARHWTPVHLDVAVEDLDVALARALGAGAKQEGEVAAREWGRIVVLSDPFGNGFCLLQFTARGYDAIAST